MARKTKTTKTKPAPWRRVGRDLVRPKNGMTWKEAEARDRQMIADIAKRLRGGRTK